MTWFFFYILTQEKPLIYFDMILEARKKNITNITTIILAKKWNNKKNMINLTTFIAQTRLQPTTTTQDTGRLK